MKVQGLTLGAIGTHCYIGYDEETGDAFVIDPADRADVIIQKLESAKLTLKAILLTHGHGDHIMACSDLKEKYKAPLMCHEAEEKMLLDPALNLSGQLFGKGISLTPDRLLKDGELLEIGSMKLQVFHTPGHTPGGCCYYAADEKVLFAGDTLFCGSVGRTDFPGGSMSQIVNSIKDKLLPLPDETTVCPGHGELTDIASEKKYNPYLG